MPPPPAPDGDDSESRGVAAALEQARRDKLARIAALGHDPWGRRFDGTAPIATVRAAGEPLRRPASAHAEGFREIVVSDPDGNRIRLFEWPR